MVLSIQLTGNSACVCVPMCVCVVCVCVVQEKMDAIFFEWTEEFLPT